MSVSRRIQANKRYILAHAVQSFNADTGHGRVAPESTSRLKLNRRQRHLKRESNSTDESMICHAPGWCDVPPAQATEYCNALHGRTKSRDDRVPRIGNCRYQVNKRRKRAAWRVWYYELLSCIGSRTRRSRRRIGNGTIQPMFVVDDLLAQMKEPESRVRHANDVVGALNVLSLVSEAQQHARGARQLHSSGLPFETDFTRSATGC